LSGTARLGKHLSIETSDTGLALPKPLREKISKRYAADSVPTLVLSRTRNCYERPQPPFNCTASDQMRTRTAIRLPEITTAVVAAAGSATRMWPASKVIPKELFPLGRLPVIMHLVAEFVSAGLSRIVLVATAQNTEMMRALFDRSVAPPPKLAQDPIAKGFDSLLARAEIVIIQQAGAYGNATPLVSAAEYVGNEPCIYAFGDDVVLGENITKGLIGVFHRTGRPVLACQQVEPRRKSSFGILECENDGNALLVTRLIEKPLPSETASSLASFGRYLVTPDLLQTLLTIPPGRDNELWFVDGVIQQIHEGCKIYAFPLTEGSWYTVGDPDSYARAVAAVTQATPAVSASITPPGAAISST
jgi:UTP--glucose-1-phosphate uridylyltransferase